MRLLNATASALLITATPALTAERVDLSGSGAQQSYSLGWSAAGAEVADPLVRGCPGFAEAVPAIEANLAAPGDLYLYLAGEGMEGALVVQPGGLHVCATPNVYGYAALVFHSAGAGAWGVHPLASAAGAEVSGIAIVSSYEIGTRDIVRLMGLTVDPSVLPPLLSDVPLDPFAEPAFGAVALPAAGELALPLTLEGRVPTDDAGPDCRGLIDQTRPDARLSLASGEPLLAMRAESEADSTLLVVTPTGEILCSDDVLGHNPALVFENAAPGDYAVWVGVYPGGQRQPATLVIGRAAPDGVVSSGGGSPASAGLAVDAPPAHGIVDLPPEGETAEIGLTIAGGSLAGSIDDGCSGELDPSRPDLLVSVAAPAPLWLSARSDVADTTLLVKQPDGSVICNDDYLGTSAAIEIIPASPGVYAVWVGSFGGSGGSASLIVSQSPPDGSLDASASASPPPNPFVGRDLPTAVAVLDVLREDPEFASAVSWTTLEEFGPEGFTLHGVTIVDPAGQDEPISIERIAVSELDLAGLSATGTPERFAVSVEGIDYAAVAKAVRAGGPPLPQLSDAPPLSLTASLLPSDGDLAKRDIRISLSLDGQLGLAFAARMLWPEDVMALGPEFAAATGRIETIELTLDDMGFLAAGLQEFAAQGGGAPEELIAAALAELEGGLNAFGPFSPESPRGQLFAAVSARFADLDAPGTIRVRLSAPQALDAETAFGVLMADQPDPSVISVEIEHASR